MAAAALVLIVTSGCSSEGDLPLIFGQSHTVGLSISGSTTDQGVELTLGYKDKDLALVPIEPQAVADNGVNKDALSTFGSFSLDAEGQATVVKAGLGKFFATGMAARVLAEGFRCGVSDGKHESCTQR
jgi:hypothetical protein